MERVSILEASRLLNISQASVRQHIRDGNLKAYRESGPQGNSWMVELPDDDWIDSQKDSFTLDTSAWPRDSVGDPPPLPPFWGRLSHV